MPQLQVNGAKLYYEEHGSGPQAIVFAHGLLWSGEMFSAQVTALKDRYRCLTFDFRGQGRSEVTAGGYDMETLYGDAAALIQALGAAPCHYVGLSMGGFIGLRLAARRPELIKKLVLLETTADPEPAQNVPRYRQLTLVARWIGLSLVAQPVMKIMFGQKFLEDPDRAALREEMRRRLLANHRIGITRAVMGVITRAGVYEEIGDIQAPTLIMVGDQDVATVPEKSRRMHERIRGSQLTIIPGAGHTSTVEEPAVVTSAIQKFLAEGD